MIDCRENGITVQPKYIEVGQFVLISRVYPEKCGWFWMGNQKPSPLAILQKRLTLTNLKLLRSSLHLATTQFAFAHVPIRTTRIRTRNFLRMLHGDFGANAYCELLTANSCPLVGLDFNDAKHLSPIALRILDRSICYFKRELAIDRTELLPKNASHEHRAILDRNAHKLLPISLGLCADRQANMPATTTEKTCDIFFAGGLTSEVRRREITLVKQLQAMDIRVDLPTERLSQKEFFERCSRSYLVWSPEGYGWDCFRHYEAAATSSVPLINAPTIVQHQALQDKCHALYYASPHAAGNQSAIRILLPANGLVETVRRALSDRGRLLAMGQAARKWVMQHHTHEAIVNHILQSSLARSTSLQSLRL